MGGGLIILGMPFFIVWKCAGYTLAGYFINRSENIQRPNPFGFGVARTVFGMLVGIAYAMFLVEFEVRHGDVPHENLIFLAGLIPVRIAEWLAFIWLFYDDVPNIRQTGKRYLAMGVLWSYVLDLPAILITSLIPTFFWIC